MTARTETERTTVTGGVGESVVRPDGVPKVAGSFEYVNDMHADGMLWAVTRRAYVPRARIASIDTSPAWEIAGVVDVITIDDVPGDRLQGQAVRDQPVLADGEIRHWGEAVAVVAAESREAARLGAEAIKLDLEELEPLVDLETALEGGSVFRSIRLRNGDSDRRGSVVVEGTYRVGTQDQAPLGTEAGLVIPDGQGGLDIWGPTQWTHTDLGQIADSLGLDPVDVRVHPVGLGGAFGAREDLSVQTHLAMLALRTGRPVKMAVDRTESFAAHVKRHAAELHFRHEADPDGRLARVEARILLDAGAYHMTSEAVIANACYFAVGPYRCDSIFVDGWAVRTNHPPAGAMRGFGANQVNFAAEAQMDLLAEKLGMDPLELRLANAIGQGDELPTSGQTLEYPLPTQDVIRSVMAIPLPDQDAGDDPRTLPGGTGLTTRPAHVRRGIGYAVSIKNLQFAEGFDDYAEAEVEITAEGVVVHTAAIEVGQGMVTVLGQIIRSTLGIQDVRIAFDHTSRIGSAGSTSASRQTQMTGGAVWRTAGALRQRLLELHDGDDLSAEGVWRGGELVAPMSEVLVNGPVSERLLFRHPGTEEPDDQGRGKVHVDFCVAAHRAVVDVDPELGLVRVVRIDTAQDVGKMLNPQSVIGQIEGGIAQGMGLAVMEELIFDGGFVRNPTFTDYLLPTALDAADVEAVIIEEPSPWGPFGAKGFAELPSISSAPAVVAAIRAATGRPLTRIPVRPEDIVGV